jgi:hypothetical protein
LTLYFADPDCARALSLNRVFAARRADRRAVAHVPELAELLLQAGLMQHWDPRDAAWSTCSPSTRGSSLWRARRRDRNDAVHQQRQLPPRAPMGTCTPPCGSSASRTCGQYRGALPRRSLYRWNRRFSLVPVDAR